MGRGREIEHIYVNNFGEGRKSGGALTTGATASLAPLHISYVSTLDDVLKLIFPFTKNSFYSTVSYWQLNL